MTSKSIVEALLYVCPDLETPLRAGHVLQDNRKWEAKEHIEYPYIKYFTNPKTIIIISKQIHIYIIGDVEKNTFRHIINIEGYNSTHNVWNKKELTEDIKGKVKQKLFLPNNFYDRIIYIYKENVYVFNRISALNCNMFTNKSKWSVGADYYSVDAESRIKERNTNAQEILDEIYKEIWVKEDS